MTDSAPRPPGGSPVAAAAGGLAVCCTVHLLVVAGIAGSVGGLAVGGIAVGAGVAVAAAVWLVAVLLRRRARGRPASCRSGHRDVGTVRG